MEVILSVPDGGYSRNTSCALLDIYVFIIPVPSCIVINQLYFSSQRISFYFAIVFNSSSFSPF
jgi:hypothetical protein